LSKLQSDVRNAEADIIKQLYGNISANDFKFDTLAAKVIPNTKYVFLGDTFKAEVLVAAFSTTQDPVLEVGFKFDSSGVPVPPLDTTGVGVSRGVGIYKTVPKTEGLVEWGGVIKIKKPDGTYQPYTFRDSYMVAKPNITVSPTAMNVFYRGLDNPVEVSAPGVALEQLKVTIDNGSLSGSKGKYTVRPGNGREANVIVSAELNGQSKKLGQMSFRVKDVPDPKPYFAGKTGSDNVSIVDLKAAQAVFAKMENFEFDLKFDIVSFTMSMNYKGNLLEKDSNSNRLTGEMVDLVKAAASKGAKVFIEKIKAKGPDGKIRDLPPISLKVL
jgi:gliding motility-associated protein GldM